ncbi:MAG TPA: hypothetical protein P5181_03700 [Dermatophilaceae bacterium]|nr:hypothetical protein [Dermatophilaceae bacterium]
MSLPQDAASMSALAVTVTTPAINRYKVNVIVDGVRMVNGRGRNVYPLAPGRHMLSCEGNNAGMTFGQADLQVDIAPGQVVETFYAAPYNSSQPGRLGFTPQQSAGPTGLGCGLALLILAAIVAVSFVILVLAR